VKHKVLIVGYGSSGKRYYKIIKDRYPEIEIKVYSYTQRKNNLFIKNKTELKLFNPSIVFFCNPSSKRIEFLDLIRDTPKIFFEKPITNNINDAKKILKNLNTKKLTAVGYNLRLLNILYFVKINLHKFLGNVYSFSCESGYNLKKWRKKNYTNTVTASRALGGGAFLELSHELDYINWIFGKKYKSEAYSINTNLLNINVEDNVKMIFNFSNKILGSLSLDLLSDYKKRFITINGAKGTLKVDLITNKITFFNNKNKLWKNINFSKNKVEDTYFDIVDFFLKKNFVRDKSQIATIQDAVFVLKTLKKFQ
jgi:predicted dehydrogenase